MYYRRKNGRKKNINYSDMFNVAVTLDDKYSFRFNLKIDEEVEQVSTGELVYIR